MSRTIEPVGQLVERLEKVGAILLLLKMDGRRRYVTSGMTQISAAPSTIDSPQPTFPVRQPIVFPWGDTSDPPAAPQQSPLPPYFRTTTSVFPLTPETASAAAVTLGLCVMPGQVSDVPVIDYVQNQSSRCPKCRAFMSQTLAAGSRCPFCGVELKFWNHFPELNSPVVDMIWSEKPRKIPKSLNKRTRCPTFVFVIDLSLEAVSSGFTHQCLVSIKSSLDSMSETARLGLITIGKMVTVYDLKRHHLWLMNDLSDVDVPDMELPHLKDCKEDFKAVLDELIARSREAESTGHCFGNALLVARKMMLDYGGILSACCCGCPTAGPYKVGPSPVDPNVPEPVLTDVQRSSGWYKDVGVLLNNVGVSVHVFHLATHSRKGNETTVIGIPSSVTNGVFHHYPEFDPRALHIDIFGTVTAEYMWDSSMSIHVSQGMKVANVLTGATVKSGKGGQIKQHFPVLKTNGCVTYQLGIERALSGGSAAFQCCFRWTDSNQRRFVRVFTFVIPTTNQPHMVKQYIDEKTLAVLTFKLAGNMALRNSPSATRTRLRNAFTQTAAGASFRSLYYYWHSILCAPFLVEGPGSADIRFPAILASQGLSFQDSLICIYPRMFAVDGSESPLPLSSDSFAMGNIILVHTSDRLFLWISPEAPAEKLRSYLGCGSIEELPSEVPELQTVENQRLHALVTGCYNLSGRYLLTEIIPPGSPREAVFSWILVDMAQTCGCDLAGYLREFPLCH